MTQAMHIRFPLKARLGDPPTASELHVWSTLHWSPTRGRLERCLRCGSVHVDGGAIAPVWCPPTQRWLDAHPEDDGRWRRDGVLGPGEPARST